jgi:hypothetical protein
MNEDNEARQLIEVGMRHYIDDTECVTFLKRYGKEIYFEKLTGLAIRHDEIHPLITYFSDGTARMPEIRAMWSYRSLADGRLTFSLNRLGKVKLWLGRLFGVLCLLTALASAALACWPPINKEFTLFATISVIMVLMAYTSAYTNWSEEAVVRVAKRRRGRPSARANA